MYVKWFDTKMTVSKNFYICRRFRPPYVPYVLTLAGTGTRKPDVGIGQRRWPGTLQGTYRGSEGQGKCCRESLSNAAW
ncbi:unnamed protein product [Staurois parvus]|uniref:Uncharacterized protein n=1 Tax=Staurois parvus TaxID=386267 RepID=A0ABN9F276_9NEOB|nr:unnamed protein product [Staurois parvus]